MVRRLAVGVVSPVGGPPDPSVGPPDGVDHAGVEEGQEEDRNGVEEQKANLMDWVALIISFQNIPDEFNPIIDQPWDRCSHPAWHSRRNPPESFQSQLESPHSSV